MDATGRPVKTEESPALFLVSLNNQTEWFLTSIQIRLYKETEKNSRTYIGTPLAFIIEKNKYDEVRTISPMSSAHFYFNIGPFLSWESQVKGYKTEYVFEPYKWRIEAANGYKK